jgi:hypothetical protein
VVFSGDLGKALASQKQPQPSQKNQTDQPNNSPRVAVVRSRTKVAHHKKQIADHFHLPPATKPSVTTKSRPKIASKTNLKHLRAFNNKYLGISDYDEQAAAFGETFYNSLQDVRGGAWVASLPAKSELLRGPFGRPDTNHSFNQEACLETALLPIFKSGFLDPTSLTNLLDTHPLISHLASSVVGYREYDFRWIREYNTEWATQTFIDPNRVVALTAALFHFDLDPGMLMQYLGKISLRNTGMSMG